MEVTVVSFAEFMSLQPCDRLWTGSPPRHGKRATQRQAVNSVRCESALVGRDRITVVREGPQQPPMDERLVALFDWVADQIDMATPDNVVGTLEIIPERYVPESHWRAYRMYMRHPDPDALVRRWFREIEPGQVEMEERQ